ncbi:Glycosyl transferase WecB/TagA/CpsF [Trichormus variabilis ATCC 29413]|uniref:Glycosyl transferase WecB/TagA/CpsF n=2 Tax=Anabaena variabilis TaxID=264691 RepID=Q3M3J5_TRIV2|nr:MULTISPECIES: WecB/TagA/CpsF family glycosyltransferase [Nostocaceae]ABA24441.1 Glycosyl transferase WecB/TagA/CpsF [Trichormus variabilis ATCC 29413]MBC1214348.1 WecB/TagA/CpsF family glycosyltransferase [Trichormus variabilis ARAD]MBC1258204.1 WecB/TagA/CpsF family glycosyltransferase [Trichormus variabilis V5]MBC1268458.1 WecB/TagA/CpsF family glycosyltransferase [Trichormus variabilis FSR]MBC1303878.1 WecB/TagA/CpsF family glycosyltransferase [Trichormus variabilis N2B]
MKLTVKETLPLEYRYILGMRVDATSYEDATQRILAWSANKESKSVFAANVHMTMETHDNSKFARVVNNTDLVTADGMPLVWALKALGIKNASRVYGPTLTLHVCNAAANLGVPIAFYGGTTESLAAFSKFLRNQFPGIKIVSQIAPPFRPLTPEEDEAFTDEIIASGAQILFVGIGCPRQEFWIAEHKNIIPAVMLGVGAAFDFHSGRVKQAPSWMQNIGLEWFFRLIMEPKRLWKRYFKHNPRFVLFFMMQLASRKLKFK